MLTVKDCINEYISRNGNPVFVHSISGSDAELKELQSNKKLVVRKDEESGELICWLSDRYPKGTQLAITKNGARLYARTKLAPRQVQAEINRVRALAFLGYNVVTGVIAE